MWKLFGGKKTRRLELKQSRVIYLAVTAAGLILLTAGSINLINGGHEYSSAREEYDLLAELYPVMSAYVSDAQIAAAESSELFDDGSYFPISSFAYPDPGTRGLDYPEENQTDPLVSLLELNPDFIGWISVDNLINYPVVHGQNNSDYLNRTFTGQKNAAGAIFMDYRLSGGFDEQVCILYGHNMKDGSIFANLHKYRDRAFIAEHPDIIIVTLEGEILTYRVFSAIITDAWDRVYDFDFFDSSSAAQVFSKSPGGTRRFLILSTCTNNSNRDERLLIYAALVN